MKEPFPVTSMIVELTLDQQPARSMGKWPWPETLPREGDTIEHEGSDYEVTSVRWSTVDPHQVEVRVGPR